MEKTAFHVAIMSTSPYGQPWTEGGRNLRRRMAQAFIQRGADVTIIAPPTSQAMTRGPAGEQVLDPSGARGVFTWFGRLANPQIWLNTARIVRHMEPQPDVLVLTASVTSVLGLRITLLKLATRKPLVLYVTGLGKPRAGHKVGLRPDRVIVGSEFLRGWLPNAAVIPPFSPTISTPSNERIEPEQKGTFNILYIGTFRREWGVEYLVQATALAQARTEKQLKLILAWNGAGASNYPKIQHLIDDLGIRHIVDVRGKEDPRDLYSEADILAIPRVLQEQMAFPVRIVEAIYMRKPLVVTRVCGMEKAVAGVGLAVGPKDAEALASAILELAENETLRQQLAANCEGASRRFDANVALDRFFRELSELVQS